MKQHKRLLCPQRRRKLPSGFSWIDHRLVRDSHIEKCGPKALAVYLFLVTVADAEGISYYGDGAIGRRLHLDGEELALARKELVQAELIAWEHPLYQVLDLDCSSPLESTALQVSPSRSGAVQSLGEILRQAAGKGGAQ